jgi:hypothetical protein
MTRTQDDLQLLSNETLESLWEQFERTGSVQAFLKFQALSRQAPSSEEN